MSVFNAFCRAVELVNDPCLIIAIAFVVGVFLVFCRAVGLVNDPCLALTVAFVVGVLSGFCRAVGVVDAASIASIDEIVVICFISKASFTST